MSAVRTPASAVAIGVVCAVGALLAFDVTAPVRGEDSPEDGAVATDLEPLEPELVFGVVPQSDLTEAEMRLVRSVGSFRVWFNWGAVESRRGSFDWSGPDRLVELASRAGVIPLPFLFGSPAWAATGDGIRCYADECVPVAPRSPETRSAFASFAAAAVERYGPGGSFWDRNSELPYRPIRVWQIWNEPNLKGFFRPRPDPLLFAELVEATASAIREADPDAEIVLGGMWGPRKAPRAAIPTTRFLRELYAVPEIEDSFDGLGVHPYDGTAKGALAQVAGMRRIARRRGDRDVELWVTELGWASGGPRGQTLVKDEVEQARLLRRVFGQLYRRRERWRIRGLYWYAWRDTPRHAAVCRWCPRAGLHSVGGRAKPAWRELVALAAS